jgi:hypothetical protein
MKVKNPAVNDDSTGRDFSGILSPIKDSQGNFTGKAKLYGDLVRLKGETVVSDKGKDIVVVIQRANNDDLLSGVEIVGSFRLFLNSSKSNDRHPDLRGEGTFGKSKMWVSGWVRDGKFSRFVSLAFEDKKAAEQRKSERAKAATAEPLKSAVDDEAIPF